MKYKNVQRLIVEALFIQKLQIWNIMKIALLFQIWRIMEEVLIFFLLNIIY